MSKCEYCGELAGVAEVVDDDDPSGVAMICLRCQLERFGTESNCVDDLYGHMLKRLTSNPDYYSALQDDQCIYCGILLEAVSNEAD